MKNPLALGCILLLATRAALSAAESPKPSKPNVILILADDLGYGDVGCYNKNSKLPTPNLDRLACEGMRFTDAHSPATVCTPSRYSLMTGQMAFRVPRGGTVFEGVGGPSLIAPGRLTLPAMLHAKGYSTACVGKWHVGLTFFDKNGQPIRSNGVEAVQRVDFGSEPVRESIANHVTRFLNHIMALENGRCVILLGPGAMLSRPPALRPDADFPHKRVGLHV